MENYFFLLGGDGATWVDLDSGDDPFLTSNRNISIHIHILKMFYIPEVLPVTELGSQHHSIFFLVHFENSSSLIIPVVLLLFIITRTIWY